MRRTEASCTYKRTKQIAALVVLIWILSALLLSAAFILTNTDHTHDHNGPDGGCATCAQLQNAGELLRQLRLLLGVCVIAVASLVAAAAVWRFSYSTARFNTLIRLKTRMNN